MNPKLANRAVAGGAILVLLALGALLSKTSVPARLDSARRASTFFTDDTGARAMYLVLEKLLPETRQWSQPLSLLRSPEQNDSPTTLIASGPHLPLSQSEAAALRSWIGNGGQLIVLSSKGWPVLPATKVGATRTAKDHQFGGEVDFLAQFKLVRRPRSTPGNPGARQMRSPLGPDEPLRIYLHDPIEWESDHREALQSTHGPVAVEIPYLSGRIIAVGDSGFMINRALRESDNAVWLATLCAQWRNGVVLIDEFHHGFGQARGPGELTLAFLKTPWGWTVLQLGFAGACYGLLYRRRLGPVVDPPPRSSQTPTHLIDARAGLFSAAQARRLALQLICQHAQYECGLARSSLAGQADSPSAQGQMRGNEKWMALEELSQSGAPRTDQELLSAGRDPLALSGERVRVRGTIRNHGRVE